MALEESPQILSDRGPKAEEGELEVDDLGAEQALAAPPSPAGAEPSTSRWLIFSIASMALFMASIDSTIVATALPTLHRDLHTPVNWAGWTITAYQLGQVVAMPVAGKISDQFGRKKVFLICVALFSVSSLACGFASSIGVLIALRGVQALGGGAFMPSATGIVSDHFGRDRDRAIGLFTSIFPIGGLVGPTLGGIIVGYWTWRGIFWINVPIGIALIVLGLRFIPHIRPKVVGRTDFVGVALLGSLILCAMYAITSLGEGTTRPWDPAFVVPSLASIALGYFFMRHTHRAPSPFIPPMLLQGKGFATMNVLNLMFGASALGFGALVPLYAEDRYHIAVLQAGTLLSARGLGMIVVAGFSSYMLRRTGYRAPMMIGFVVIAGGVVLLAIAPHGLGPYGWLGLGAAITGLGMGTASPATNNATLQLAPDQVAAIAGLRGMFRQAGAIVAVSATTAVVARSTHPGLAQADVFYVLAGLLLLLVPVVLLVPEHKGSW